MSDQPSVVPVVVHITRGGLPLCRFTHKQVIDWPKGDTWVGYFDQADATCPACRGWAKIMSDLKWRGPHEKPMNFVCLPREWAEAIAKHLL